MGGRVEKEGHKASRGGGDSALRMGLPLLQGSARRTLAGLGCKACWDRIDTVGGRKDQEGVWEHGGLRLGWS